MDRQSPRLTSRMKYLRAELGGSGTILDLVLVLSAGKGGAEYQCVFVDVDRRIRRPSQVAVTVEMKRERRRRGLSQVEIVYREWITPLYSSTRTELKRQRIYNARKMG